MNQKKIRHLGAAMMMSSMLFFGAGTAEVMAAPPYPDIRNNKWGVADAKANKNSGSVYASAIGYEGGGNSVAEAGFKSAAEVFSTGSTKATAKIQINKLFIDGGAKVVFKIVTYEDGKPMSGGLQYGTPVTGANMYEAKTPSFQIVPGKKYQAEAFISCGSTGDGSACICYSAKILSIDFSKEGVGKVIESVEHAEKMKKFVHPLEKQAINPQPEPPGLQKK